VKVEYRPESAVHRRDATMRRGPPDVRASPYIQGKTASASAR
jgi:hypothetical protein